MINCDDRAEKDGASLKPGIPHASATILIIKALPDDRALLDTKQNSILFLYGLPVNKALGYFSQCFICIFFIVECLL